ncbi:MAG TPA: nucleotidyltransferase family protein [Caldilineae bacterium]|nr:nucleotidyltransferase family protein [Caldilineae bacterium]
MISAIVLAAGMSRRMGRPKLLLPLGDELVIQRVVRTVMSSAVDETIVVVGHRRAEMEEALTHFHVRVVYNPDYAQGEMLSSIQAGLRAASLQAAAALIVLGDQPGIPSTVIDRIVATLREHSDRICLPTYGGRRGHPIGLPRRFWPEVLALGWDASLRDVIRNHQANIVEVAVPDEAILMDMDTPEDYEWVIGRLE